MSPTGFKTVRTSDLSGADLKDDEVVTVAVRSHPDFPDGRVFDAAADELANLKPVTNLVALELRYPDGTTKEVQVSKTEFSKVVSNEVLAKADGLRGRRKGYSPLSNGNA